MMIRTDFEAPPWLNNLSDYFSSKNHQLYLVGGAVRDQLRAQAVREWDLTTDARPPQIERLLKELGAKQIGRLGERFGTITATLDGEPLEITTFRGEHYLPDSRLPEVTFGDNLADDLARRDFTINAIAFDISAKRLVDNFNGQVDLAHNLIRAVGNPVERFTEDPLRMLRAVRFASQFDYTIEETTLAAISQVRDRFGLLSAERVAAEMDKILLSPVPSVGVNLLTESGLINYILPELLPAVDLEFDPREHKDIYHHILQVLDQTPPKIELRWCALLHDIAKPLTRRKIDGQYHFLGHEIIGAKMTREILGRLRYSGDFIKYVSNLVRFHQRLPNYTGDWSHGGIRRFVRDAGNLLDDLFLFAEADSTGSNEAKKLHYRSLRQQLRDQIDELNRQAEIAKIKSPLDGMELMAIFNRPAGPWIKPVKEHLLALVLDGELAAEDKERATVIARQLVSLK